MADIVKPIQYADEVIKLVDQATYFRQECLQIKAKTEILAAFLRQAAPLCNGMPERPTRLIIDDTEQVLNNALTLVSKCRNSNAPKTIPQPQSTFRRISIRLDNSIGDVSWLLRVYAIFDANEHVSLGLGGLPPIAGNEPMLCLIWEQIAILCTDPIEQRADAAASLVSITRDSDRYGRMIIEEGGVAPLLKLAEEGGEEGQGNAARAIGLLCRDLESVEKIMNAGAYQVFAKILKQGNLKVQIEVAWAVSQLAAHRRKRLDHPMTPKHSKCAVNENYGDPNQMHKKKHDEFEYPATKGKMKSMAARVLRYLCPGKLSI